MKLVLIHGAPATGKLTVARALSELTGAPLVDNHAAIDIARMIFAEFSVPGFWELVHDVRVSTLRAAARAEVPVLITTAAYSDPVDAPLLRDYDDAIETFGGVVVPVFLSCSRDTLMERVVAPDRARRGKIATTETLSAYLARNTFVAIPRDTCLSFSTETAPPRDTAAAIAERLGLPPVDG